MAAPAVIGFEEVPQGEPQQVFVPCFVPMPVAFVQPSAMHDMNEWGTQGYYGYNGYSMSPQTRPRKAGARKGMRSHMWDGRADSLYGLNGSSAPSQLSAETNSQKSDSGLGPDAVIVLLSNLPKQLCTRKCMEAVIEASKLDQVVLKFEVLTDKAEAVLGADGEFGAQRVIKYFHGLQWAKSTQPVVARYCAKARMYLENEEHIEKDVTKEVLNHLVQTTPRKTKPFEEPPSPLTPGGRRWVDYDSDDDLEEDDGRSTFAGTDATSDGESTFAGTDVTSIYRGGHRRLPSVGEYSATTAGESASLDDL